MEMFYTIQGEGYHTGKPAFFIRIGGCDIGCHWCDVKESWNANLHPLTQVNDIVNEVSKSSANSVVITGGEPLIYNLEMLTKTLKSKNIATFIETSGAYPITGQWDWICLSPKKNSPPLEENYQYAGELKVIVHNKNDLAWAQQHAVKVKKETLLYLQPEWSKREEILPAIIDFVKSNPLWRISIQSHKYINIP
ncbi:MAG: 7-carboxy-7-deazaguanine synthase QueE [Sphingobacteriaceae bacterium]|nr:7-carboxy-7-deazaguanine synthase QueE [Sphingobacteriaceae bacterium]